MRSHRLLGVLGKTLVGFGLTTLAFLAYQLWGTWLIQHWSQQNLRAAIAPREPVAQSVAKHYSPPQIGGAIGVIDIPSIGVNKAVVQGVGEANLAEGPGHYPGTPMPGERGNVGIAGHRTTFGGPFYRLNYLKPGNLIFLTTSAGTFRYLVQRSLVVKPTDTSVVGPSNANILTLTTCTPLFSAADRLVVVASLQGKPWTPPSGGNTPSRHPGAAPVSTPWIYSLASLGGVGSPYLAPFAWGAAVLLVGSVLIRLMGQTGRRILVWLPGAAVVACIVFVFFTSLNQVFPPSL